MHDIHDDGVYFQTHDWFWYNRDMKPLTRKQKQEIGLHARFWMAHAGHWMVAALFIVFTLSLVYTFWGNDPVFAATVMGGY
jgi:hypothetical protein